MEEEGICMSNNFSEGLAAAVVSSNNCNRYTYGYLNVKGDFAYRYYSILGEGPDPGYIDLNGTYILQGWL
jgi:hypothetical protein